MCVLDGWRGKKEGFLKFHNATRVIFQKVNKNAQALTIGWLVAGVALATALTALAAWTWPTTTMFMDTFSAPIFVFGVWLVFVKTAKRRLSENENEHTVVFRFAWKYCFVCTYRRAKTNYAGTEATNGVLYSRGRQ